MWSWLLHTTGTDDPTSNWYAWWSGFGSDLTELAIIGALATLVRKHNCEQHRCWRLGRHTTAAGHHVCRKHHPDGHLTAADIHRAHREATDG